MRDVIFELSKRIKNKVRKPNQRSRLDEWTDETNEQAKDVVPKSQVPQLGHQEPISGACRCTSARHGRPAEKGGLRGTAWADGATRGVRMRSGLAHAQKVAFRQADRPAGEMTS